MGGFHDTIAAIATAQGPSGVAVVRVSGPDAESVAGRLIGFPLPAPRHAVLRAVRAADGRLLDRALVLVFKAPASYTGEDAVEFQCHGGTVTPRRILEAAFAAGARLARRGEFTERAFLNGKLGYDEAESVLDLINAKTVRAAETAVEGLEGRTRKTVRDLYDRALTLSSALEHALDVSEDELPPAFIAEMTGSLDALRDAVASALRHAREGRLLRTGALVVLAGPPNAGKSSLLNVLLGENRAIVSDIPGTTRDTIEEWMDLGGFPVRLVDTAGLRDTADAIEAEGVRRSEELIARADIVVALDCDCGLRVHSKCDLGHGPGLNVSARTGEGIAELKAALVRELEHRLDSTAPAPDDATVSALLAVQSLLVPSSDLVLLANSVRSAAERLGALVGATYSDDLLDKLFSRFCIGK